MTGELGVDRIFGRGTTPREVASYLVARAGHEQTKAKADDDRASVGLTVDAPAVRAVLARPLRGQPGRRRVRAGGCSATWPPRCASAPTATRGCSRPTPTCSSGRRCGPGTCWRSTATVTRVGTRSRTIEFDVPGGVPGPAGPGRVGRRGARPADRRGDRDRHGGRAAPRRRDTRRGLRRRRLDVHEGAVVDLDDGRAGGHGRAPHHRGHRRAARPGRRGRAATAGLPARRAAGRVLVGRRRAAAGRGRLRGAGHRRGRAPGRAVGRGAGGARRRRAGSTAAGAGRAARGPPGRGAAGRRHRRRRRRGAARTTRPGWPRRRLRVPVVRGRQRRRPRRRCARCWPAAGCRSIATDNVLPRIGVLDPAPARAAIREVFLRHVIGGKRLSRGPAVRVAGARRPPRTWC